jgi:hypothetical protein
VKVRVTCSGDAATTTVVETDEAGYALLALVASSLDENADEPYTPGLVVTKLEES